MDYTKLSQEQLVQELVKRDETITNLNSELTLEQTKLNDTISQAQVKETELNNTINNLKEVNKAYYDKLIVQDKLKPIEKVVDDVVDIGEVVSKMI